MLIDWFTVGAQALNFIVLVWLLKHFLYKPILTAIDAREQRIATALADAGRQKSEAQREREEFEEKNKKFGEDRDALMAKATLEADVERGRLMDNARQLADELLKKRKIGLHENAVILADQLKRLAAMEVFDIARKALADLASGDLEERLGEVFTRRLRQLKPEAKASLGAVLKAANASAIVRSRFGLPAMVQATIRNALNETFAADIGLSFATAPDSPTGIELTVSGQRLSWGIAEYLDVLEEKVEALLSADAESAQSEPNSAPTPATVVTATPAVSAMLAPKAPPAGVPLLASPTSEPPVRTQSGPAHAMAS